MDQQNRIFDAQAVFGTIPRELAMEHSGLELFGMMLAGKLPQPPIAGTLNFRLAEAEEGRVVYRGVPLFDFYNPMGSIHGGWPATLLDSALGCAVHSKLPAGTDYSTVEFKIHLVRPMFEATGEVVCEGRLLHMGRSIATSEADIRNADGKLIAHGTETCAIFPL